MIKLLRQIVKYKSNVFRFSKVNQTEKRLKDINFEQKRKQALQHYNEDLKIYQKRSKQRRKLLLQKEKSNNNHEYSESQRNKIQQIDHQQKTILANKYQNTMNKIKLEQKTVKVQLYLSQNLKDHQQIKTQKKIQEEQKEKGKAYIPKDLVLKKIYHSSKQKFNKIPTNHQILLAGAKKDQEHCLFLKKIIQQLDIKNVITLMSSDLPYFIKTEGSYTQEWKKFLEDPQYSKRAKFFINPKPKTLTDICLHNHHIPIIKSSLSRSKLFLDSFSFMSQFNDLQKKYEPNPFLTGLYAHNVQKIYFADYPAFKEREMIANNVSLDRMRELFQEFVRNLEKGNKNFNVEWLFPKNVLSVKLDYILSIARAVSESSKSRSIIICPSDMVELLSIQWQLNTKNSNLYFNYDDSNYYLKFQQPSQEKKQTFIQFIQKLIILDLIMEPLILPYFVKYKSFPFLCKHTIGGLQNVGKIFVIWVHYYKIYHGILTEKKLIPGDGKDWSRQLDKFENPNTLV